MAERLTANVILLGPDGLPARFLDGTPKSEVPDWAQEQITNPALWGGDKDEEPEDKPEGDSEPEKKPAPTRKRSTAK